MVKISATIIARNEEKNIGDCLQSLDFVDEIIVVDSGSSDRTPEICRAHPKVRFFDREWLGFGRQKNVAADLASNQWILNVDADERISPELKAAILGADYGRYACFRIARENYFGRRWIRRCGWYPDYNLRLYDRNSCAFSDRSVHETLLPRGEVGTLTGNLKHFTYEGVADYAQRMDRYSTLAAEEVVKSGKVPGAATVFFKPVFTFLKMYFLKGGFLEGYEGMLLSLMYSHYTFYKYSKAVDIVRTRR